MAPVGGVHNPLHCCDLKNEIKISDHHQEKLFILICSLDDSSLKVVGILLVCSVYQSFWSKVAHFILNYIFLGNSCSHPKEHSFGNAILVISVMGLRMHFMI